MDISRPISSMMSVNLLTIQENADIDSARQLFDENDVRHLLVVKDKKLVGILSHHDLLRVSFGNTYGDDQESVDDAIVNMLKVADIMRHEPVTVAPETSIKDAIQILLDRRFHSLPIVDHNMVPVGIVTTTDFMKSIVTQ